MSTKKNASKNELKSFEELFSSVTQEERTEHEAHMLMFRFLSIVQEEMEEKGMHRKELAERIGTSASYITQLFRGHKLINLTTLAKIQEALGIRFRIDKALDEEGFWVFRRKDEEGSDQNDFPDDLPETIEGLVG